MRLFLAQSYPEGWGGVKLTGESMRLHLAERDPQHHAWPKRGADKEHMKLRILLSYWYYKDTDLDALFAKYFTQPYPDVFADSGGFSADTQGAKIDLSDYAAWIKRWAHLFTTYANLDVIGNAQATTENQSRLEDAGLAPLPVFHAGSDFAELEQLIEKYPYIALGGLVPHAMRPDKTMPWLVKAFKLAQGRSVYHGFGVTSWLLLSSLPWYSVDSSSWGQGFRYGQVPVFDEKRGKFVKAGLGKPDEWRKIALLVRSLGFDPGDFADRSRNDRAKICAISALSYMKAEQWLRRKWGEIYIPGREDAPAGLRAHLADANPARYGEAVEGAGVRLHLSDTSNGINYGDADKGLRLHLADARPSSGGDLAAADAGLRIHQTASVPSQQTEWRSRSATQSPGLRVHLAEHSLDRGG